VFVGRYLFNATFSFCCFSYVLLVSYINEACANVVSTRVVLLNGHEGGDAAGKVIQALAKWLWWPTTLLVFCCFRDFDDYQLRGSGQKVPGRFLR